MTTTDEAQAQRFQDFRNLVWIFIHDATGRDMDEWPLPNQPDYHALYDDYDCPVEAGKAFCMESWSALGFGMKEEVENLLDYHAAYANLQTGTEARDVRTKPIPVLH